MTEAKPIDGRLMRPDLWLLLCLGIAGLVFFFFKFEDSFPSASINLKLSRSQIRNSAAQWAGKLGYSDKDAVVSTVFSPDEDAKIYLEYELGQTQANALMKQEIPVWNWVTRFCKPHEIEELDVWLGPEGTLNYFSHTLPNDAPGATIDHAQAEAEARQFIEKELGLSLEGTKLIKDSQTKQLHRMDHEFIFEDQTKDYKGARLRTYLGISGDKVTDYQHFLHVPERFDRKYNELRSINSLLKRIADIVFTVLWAGVGFIFIWALASGRIRWRFVLTMAAIGGVLSVLNIINDFPSMVSEYQTTMTFNDFMVGQAVRGCLTLVMSIIGTIIMVGALEPIYRIGFPEKMALEQLFTRAGMGAAQLFRALVAGSSTFGIHTAYVVGFYLLGNKFGFWSPLEVRDASALSDLWPAFSALNVGVSAASMEELLYRVLALVIFRKLTGNFWLANLLQAASWAFMHSDYPQEPAYARGLELTIGGFFYGYILRTFGLPACFLAHYTYDAFLGITPLLSSGSLSDKVASLAVVVPGLVAVVISALMIAKNGATRDEAALSNEAIPVVKRTQVLGPEPDTHFHYKPLSRKKVVCCLVGGVIGAALCLAMPLRTIGERDVVGINREQAREIAGKYLLQNGIQTSGMTAVAGLVDETDDQEMQYIFEKSGYEKANELAKAEEPRLIWKVRFFKPKEPTEYFVSLSPAGKPLWKVIKEDEEAPGKRPTLAAVKKASDDFLKSVFPQFMPAVMVDSTKQELKDRTDFRLTYRVPKLKVADAEYEVTVASVGSELAGFSTGWQVPETWTFERKKVTKRQQMFGFMRVGLSLSVLVFSLVWLFQLVRASHINWRLPAALACFSGIVIAISRCNSLPGMLLDYQTDEAFSTFLLSHLALNATTILAGAAATGLFGAIAIAAYYSLYPDLPLKTLVRGVWPHMGKVTAATRRMWLDGLVLGVGFSFLVAGIDHLFDFGEYLTSPGVRMLSLESVSATSAEWSPAVAGLLAAISEGLFFAFASVVIAALVKHFFGRNWRWLILFVAVVALVSNTQTRYIQDYCWLVAGFAVKAAFLWVLIARLARCNVLAYVFAAFFPVLAGTAYTLIYHQQMQLYFAPVAIMALVAAAPVVYTVWLYLPPTRELEIVPPDKVA